MIARIKRNKLFSVMVLFTMLLMFLSSTLFTVFAADDTQNDDSENWSFYQIAAAAAGYLSDAMAPSGAGVGAADASGDGIGLKIGAAGSLMGYCDPDVAGGVTGWLQSKLSSGSNVQSYSTYLAVFVNDSVDGAPPTKVTESLFYYGRYGHLLNQIGFDNSGTDMTLSLRKILGPILLVAYLLSNVTPALFHIVIELLQVLNPFQAFSTVSTYLGDVFDSDTNGLNGWYGVAKVVGKWYNALFDLSWAVIVPIFFVALIIMLFLSHSQGKAKKIKKFCIRVFFIVLGVPICGSLYTVTLSKLGDITSSKNGAAGKVIASILIDFEAWARNCRLAVPPGVTLETNTGQTGDVVVLSGPSVATISSLRSSCFAINSASGSIPSSMSALVTGTSTDTLSKLTEYNSAATKSRYNNEDADTGDAILDLIERYSNSTKYEASSYESYVKSIFDGWKSNSDFNQDLSNMIAHSDEVDDYKISKAGDWAKARFNNPNYWHNGDMKANIFNDCGLAVIECDSGVQNEGGVITYDATKAKQLFTRKIRFIDVNNGISKNAVPGVTQGLSTLSMYNYLTTSFNESNMVIYSSDLSPSGFVKESHYSVNLIGKGFTSALLFGNSLILLGCYIVLGWYYAFGMFFASVKRGFRLITSVPFALLGSIRSIAKVITYTVVLIVEVIVSIFIYLLVAELLFNIATIVEGPFATALTAANLTMFVNNASALTNIFLIFSSIVLVVFTIISLKLRKTVVKAVDQAAEEIIHKFLDVNNPPEQPSMAQKAMNAVAGGVGAGIGHRIADRALPKNTAPAPGSEKKDVGTGENTNKDSGNEDNGGNTEQIGNETGPQALPSPGSDPDNTPGGGKGGGNKATTNGTGNKNGDIHDTLSFTKGTNGDKEIAKGLGNNDSLGNTGEKAIKNVRNMSGAQVKTPNDVKQYVNNNKDRINKKAEDKANTAYANVTGATSVSTEEKMQEDMSRIKRDKWADKVDNIVTGAPKLVNDTGQAVASGVSGDYVGVVKHGSEALNDTNKMQQNNAEINQKAEQKQSEVVRQGLNNDKQQQTNKVKSTTTNSNDSSTTKSLKPKSNSRPTPPPMGPGTTIKP